jgi:hypothetical protein
MYWLIYERSLSGSLGDYGIGVSQPGFFKETRGSRRNEERKQQTLKERKKKRERV